MWEAHEDKLLAIKHKRTSARETSKQNCNILYTVMGSNPPPRRFQKLKPWLWGEDHISGTSVNCKSRCDASAFRTEGGKQQQKKTLYRGGNTGKKKELGALGAAGSKWHARKHRLL